MSRYAENTSVPVEKSEAEIKKIIQRYGATAFGSFEDERGAQILFEVNHKRKADRFWKTPGKGVQRSQEQAFQAWEHPFYNTRHTYISSGLSAGRNPKWMCEQVGTSMAMLEKHYGKYMPDLEDGSLDRFL